MLAGLASGAGPYGLSRMPMPPGPTANGRSPAIARAEAAIAGSASSVSITERSSAAWTIAEVEKVTLSMRSSGGRFRFNSVK